MNTLVAWLNLLVTSLITCAVNGSEPGCAELLFVGDAMQHQAQLDCAHSLGGYNSYNYDDCFSLIAPEVGKADYAVANLEVALGGGPKYTGYPCFSAPDSYAVALKNAGFDLMLTANNHCLDRLDDGIRRTVWALDSLKVDHIGTYNNIADRSAKVPFIKEINGMKIGFLNYTYGTNGLEARKGAEVSLIDRAKMAEEITQARQAGAELLVVCVHWGEEYVLLPNTHQKNLAQFLIDEGVDMIIGGHPHVIQPMEIVHNDRDDKDVLVVYSLGNFISAMRTTDTRGGALVRAYVKRDTDGKVRFKSANYDTFFVAMPDGQGSNYVVVPSWMPDNIPASQRAQWQAFDASAQRIFNNHNVGVPRKHQ